MKHLKVLIGLLLALTQQQAESQIIQWARVDTVPVIVGTDSLDFPWAGGLNYCQFSKIDLDLDGTLDLFVFDRTGNKVLTFLTDPSKSTGYAYAPTYEKDFPTDLNSWVLLRDFNCDGKQDIFTYTPGGIKVYKNTSDTSLKFQVQVNLLYSSQLGNWLNLFVSSVDIPSITDIDDDGDLDVLTFGLFGTFLEYHRNYSIENGHNCDSLEFVMKNECWGHFSENPSYCSIVLYDTCTSTLIPGGPEFSPTGSSNWSSTARSAERHTGSTVLALDANGVNSKDLIISDISCNNLTLLINGGSSPNVNSSMVSKDTAFPSNTVPVNLSVFPAAFNVDVDNDGLRDLIVSPNSTVQSNNITGNLYYRNTGTNTTPVFNFLTDGFLQRDMIENGEGASPVFFDHNNDGLMDLVIANYALNSGSGLYQSKMQLFENIGSLSNPVFKWITSDYSNLSSSLNKVALIPAFGDLDGDGDNDMIVGDVDGNVHYFKNNASSGSPASFVPFQLLLSDNTATTIDVGQNAYPFLVDMDNDSDLDLIIGEKNATINYYKNIGTLSSPVFQFMTDTLGGVHVNEPWTPFGYSAPTIYPMNGKLHMWVGSAKGQIYHYDSISNNLSGTFRLVDTLKSDDILGIRSAPAITQLNNDWLPDLIQGTYRGGLGLFLGADQFFNVAIEESEPRSNNHLLRVYPNPFATTMNISLEKDKLVHIQITDVQGRLLYDHEFGKPANEFQLSTIGFKSGIFLITVRGSTGYNYQMKLVKE